ncbi:hypothetical protein B5X24_HaOG204518 [Helicoverpa armigera]|uniref:Uncharacterized protein n=1 Tax=Helicoverpa armigera TaxID=29058 RepID=A0A2W1BNG8_HELAM|nr:hypothetical protein B5X24_HaOG204518 [Helicoverpa armigera]
MTDDVVVAEWRLWRGCGSGAHVLATSVVVVADMFDNNAGSDERCAAVNQLAMMPRYGLFIYVGAPRGAGSPPTTCHNTLFHKFHVLSGYLEG